jgi:hypothetical protein
MAEISLEGMNKAELIDLKSKVDAALQELDGFPQDSYRMSWAYCMDCGKPFDLDDLERYPDDDPKGYGDGLSDDFICHDCQRLRDKLSNP